MPEAARGSVVELRRLASVLPSNVDKKSKDGEQAIRLCNYTDVYYSEFISADMDLMEATATEPQIQTFSLRAGDVILTKDSETADDIGVPAFVPEAIPGVVCGYHLSLVRVSRPDFLMPEFLFWYFNSFTTRHALGSRATGVTRFGIRLDAVQSLPIPLWPLDEQADRVSSIRSEIKRIDRAQALLGTGDSAPGSLSAVLREERQALIDDMVHSDEVRARGCR